MLINMNPNKLIFFSKITIGITIFIYIFTQILIVTLDINKYREKVIRLVQTQTAHRLSIDGDFRIILSPFPIVVIENIKLDNAEWGINPVMFDAKRVEVKLALLPLLNKNITIKKLTIIQPHIYIENDNNNELNWLFKKQENNTVEQNISKTEVKYIKKSREYKLNKIEIKDATVVLNDSASGKSIKFARSYANISINSFQSPIKFIMGGNYNKRRFNINGELNNLMSLINNQKTSFNTNIIISHINTNISGYIEKPLALKGFNLDFISELDSLRTFNRLLGKDFPHVGPNYLHMTLTDELDDNIVKDFNIIIGDTKINGDIRILLSEYRPSIYATLHTNYFDTTPYINKKNKNIDVNSNFNSDLIKHIDKIDASLQIDEFKFNDEIENDVKYKIQLFDGILVMKKELN